MIGSLLAIALAVQTSAQEIQPVLTFPEPGLDDSAAYRGYRTRFLRDAAGNAVQVYVDSASARVVHVWADAANESAAFTVRDTTGRPRAPRWGAGAARAWSSGETRFVRYELIADARVVRLGLFVLGSMRVERDFQYQRRHLEPLTAPPFRLPEVDAMLDQLAQLDGAERRRHLRLLDAARLDVLERRVGPTIGCRPADENQWACTVEHVSFDGQQRLALTLQGDAARIRPAVDGRVLILRSRSGEAIHFSVTVSTTAPALTPLTRERMFNDAFREFYAAVRADRATNPLRFRRLERQVRGTELLAYREKLMASLPNYATYFGRDMMMAALMMEPIWTAEMAEHVIAAVLRKLAPSGEASHEEALAGQAIRENAARYSRLLEAYRRTGADSLLVEARAVAADLDAVRENYHMVDDDFQLPVLVSRYLRRSDVSADRKRRFLQEAPTPGSEATHLDLVLRNLTYAAERTAPYAREPNVQHLVAFPRFEDDSGWFPGSWRDSRVGYGGGRFAMDVNAAWAPAALDAMGSILSELERLGWSKPWLTERVPRDRGEALRRYIAEPEALRSALETWRGARRHFEVVIPADEVDARLATWLRGFPEPERGYWSAVVDTLRVPASGLRFLAVSLDAAGRPIPVMNTDVATLWFLDDVTAQVLRGERQPAAVVPELNVFLQPYPLGLLVPGLGPLVANDAFAAREVQQAFHADQYHSPRVVWGREVNLFVLALSRQISAAYDSTGRLRRPDLAAYVAALVRALSRVRSAVEASGLKDNELWSYRIEGGRLEPSRYGASSDIQLWNLTDLAVQFALARLPARAFELQEGTP